MDSVCRIGIQDNTHTAEARRSAAEFASMLGFDETEAGNLGVVVTEAVRNLLKHAGGGDLILRTLHQNGRAMVEMLAVDKGPGMADISRSFEDGYSTAGTPGTGLGAISRLSSLHDIYSQPKQGTALLAHVGKRNRVHQPIVERFRLGAVSVAHPGETVCGDAWEFLELPGTGVRLLVADGLGHGLLAADAARAAMRVAQDYPRESGKVLMHHIHAALRPTRGAAVAIAELDYDGAVLRFTGIGNIAGSIVSPDGGLRHMVSHPGTAGHELHKIAEFQYPWAAGSTLIMHSDGLSSHWSIDRYPGLLSRHPSLIAGVLYRDFHRQRDDATVIVFQETRS